MSKKIIISVIEICLLVVLACCGKKTEPIPDPVPDPDPVPVPDPVPAWSITQTNPDYTSSMTMIMAMPESFTVTENDMMSVFSGEECVGLAKNPVSTPYGYRFFIYVIKPLNTDLFLSLKMYSFDKQKLYVKENYCKYWMDEVLGTLEQPIVFEP